MVETALLGQVNDLEGFEDLGQFGGRDISVDVEDLALASFGQRGQDGESAGADGSLDWFLVNFCDSTDESVTGLIEVLRGEDTGCDGTSASTECLESRDELEVLGQEDATSMRKSASVGDPNTCG